MTDKKTVQYFEKYVPEYTVDRLDFCMSFLSKNAKEDQSLIDIGCGTGNILEMVLRETKLTNLNGLDISRNYLDIVSKKIKCNTIEGSILDNNIALNYSGKFDYVIISAVLHHLVGKTRQESYQNSIKALINCLELLKPGGFIILQEQTYYTELALSIIFYVKKIVTKIIPNIRIEIFGKWNNIGEPVVSMFTPSRLEKLILSIPDCTIVDKQINKRYLPLLLRLSIIINEKHYTTYIIQKNIN